jgi:ATP-dependent metalloprotease FtsH
MAEYKKTNQNNNNPGKLPQGGRKFNFYTIYILIALVLIAMYFFNSPKSIEEINWTRFEKIIEKGDYQKIVVVNKEYAEIYIKPDALKNDTNYKDVAEGSWGSALNEGPHYKMKFITIESFENNIKELQDRMFRQDTIGIAPEEIAQLEKDNRIELTPETRKNWSGDLLGWLIPIGFFVVIWILIMRSMSRGSGGAGNIFNVGKSKAQLFDKDSSVAVTFKDVAGLDEAKVEIVEIVDFLKSPKKYTSLGGKIPKGVLLVGPPGTGKTLLAKAVAGEAKVPFFSMSGSDFVEMFVGVGASRVRDLFKQAKEKAPCIVFIDEIDAIGRARGRNAITGSNDERENTLNQLLTEMDGFSSNTGVIILAATNRADILDKALMRAGRFDRLIYIELPDLNGREDIFKVHLKPLKLGQDVDAKFLAKQTPGFSGADIANVCNEAALIAARRDKKSIERQDFLDAVDRIIGGLEKRNKIISPEEKKVIAFHEAGHASVSWLLPHAHPLVKVTIVPRGKALGAAWYLPEERQITTSEQLFDEMTATLGGRAAEDVIFGKVSTGALNDLERVTKQAYAAISYFGLNEKIGNLSFFDSSGAQEYVFQKPYSEKTAEIIDEEASKLVEKAYSTARQLIIDNRAKVEELANRLLTKEVIFKEDVEEIFGKRVGEKDEQLSHENQLAAEIEDNKEVKQQKQKKSSENDVLSNKKNTNTTLFDNEVSQEDV